MNKFKSGLLMSVLTGMLALAGSSSSIAQDAKGDTSAKLQKILQARLPRITIEKVQPSQWPFLYEVVTDGELFYVDVTGDYLFYGKVMDTRTREDLTGKRWNELLSVDFKSLPFDLAFKEVKGDGSRKLAVFADPHCPFCVRFEKTLQEVNNVTVYTFLFPLESIHPGATDDARKIWCAADRAAAWRDLMLNKKTPPEAKCKTEQVDALVKLGEKMKVTGTPTLIFEDGHRVPGAIDKNQLEDEFAAASDKPKG